MSTSDHRTMLTCEPAPGSPDHEIWVQEVARELLAGFASEPRMAQDRIERAFTLAELFVAECQHRWDTVCDESRSRYETIEAK